MRDGRGVPQQRAQSSTGRDEQRRGASVAAYESLEQRLGGGVRPSVAQDVGHPAVEHVHRLVNVTGLLPTGAGFQVSIGGPV